MVLSNVPTLVAELVKLVCVLVAYDPAAVPTLVAELVRLVCVLVAYDPAAVPTEVAELVRFVCVLVAYEPAAVPTEVAELVRLVCVLVAYEPAAVPTLVALEVSKLDTVVMSSDAIAAPEPPENEPPRPRSKQSHTPQDDPVIVSTTFLLASLVPLTRKSQL